jgi:hypothetical protein
MIKYGNKNYIDMKKNRIKLSKNRDDFVGAKVSGDRMDKP